MGAQIWSSKFVCKLGWIVGLLGEVRIEKLEVLDRGRGWQRDGMAQRRVEGGGVVPREGVGWGGCLEVVEGGLIAIASVCCPRVSFCLVHNDNLRVC